MKHPDTLLQKQCFITQKLILIIFGQISVRTPKLAGRSQTPAYNHQG